MPKYKCDNCTNEFTSEQEQNLQCPNCHWSSSVRKCEDGAKAEAQAGDAAAQNGGQINVREEKKEGVGITAKVKICPKCHESNNPALVQCWRCKTSLFIPKKTANGMMQCPYCAEEIKEEAIKCKHCGSSVTPPRVVTRETGSVKQGGYISKKGNGVGLFVAIFLAVILLAAVLPNLNRARDNTSPSNNPTNPTKVQGENGLLKEYYGNGRLKSEGVFKNGHYEGMLKLYFENGQLSSEAYCGDEGEPGWSRMYHENGQLFSELVSHPGGRAGLFRGYNENGQLTSETAGGDNFSEQELPWFLASGMIQGPKLEKNCIYSLSGMQVMQTVNGGVLMRVDPHFEAVMEVAFLYTDENFVDGTSLNEYWARYDGSKQYQSVIGAEKNVHAFRLYGRGQVQRSYYPNRVVRAETLVNKEGKQDGWTSVYREDGTLEREVFFKNGVQDGLTIDYYKNGYPRNVAFFKNGWKEGWVKDFYENGYLSVERVYKDGKPNGAGKDYYKNGNLQSVAFFKDGLQEGLMKGYHENGKLKMEVSYQNGHTEGPGKLYDENGRIKGEYSYNNGVLDGMVKTYYGNGRIERESSFKNGVVEGVVKTYYESGSLRSSANFSRDIENGLSERYLENGDLLWRWNYINGKWSGGGESVASKGIKDGPNAFYFKNKTLAYDMNILKGKINGLLREYYQNGKIRMEMNFLMGVPDGFFKYYTVDGTLETEGSYVEGTLRGAVKTYMKDGLLSQEINYKEGMRTALNFFHPARRTSSSYRGELLPPSAANFFHFVTPPATV